MDKATYTFPMTGWELFFSAADWTIVIGHFLQVDFV